MYRFLALTIFLLLFFFTSYTPAHAAIECSGKVTNQDSSPLNEVQITLYKGLISAPNTSTSPTIADGSYAFSVEGFGIGLAETHKVVFSLNNYKDKIIDYKNGGVCPGDIILESTETKGGYKCNKGACEQTGETAQFSDEASCKTDCGIFLYDEGRLYCRPDPSGTYYSLRECQNQTPITSVDKYKYNPQSKTCVQDVNGEPLEDCQKHIVDAVVVDCKTTNNCTKAGGEVCNIADGKKLRFREWRGRVEYITDDAEERIITQENQGVYTAIGCIPTNPTALIKGLLKIAAGIGGGIALLLMIFGSFQMITSGGNPDNIKKGQEQFTSAIIGLLFIIFSVLLLQVVGVDILSLPGFNP